MKTFITLSLMAVTVIGQNNWVSMLKGKAPNSNIEVHIFVLRNSIMVNQNNNLIVTVKSIYTDDTVFSLDEYNCNSREIRRLKVGHSLGLLVDDLGEWKAYQKGTIGYKVVEKICKSYQQ